MAYPSQLSTYLNILCGNLPHQGEMVSLSSMFVDFRRRWKVGGCLPFGRIGKGVFFCHNKSHRSAYVTDTGCNLR